MYGLIEPRNAGENLPTCKVAKSTLFLLKCAKCGISVTPFFGTHIGF